MIETNLETMQAVEDDLQKIKQVMGWTDDTPMAEVVTRLELVKQAVIYARLFTNTSVLDAVSRDTRLAVDKHAARITSTVGSGIKDVGEAVGDRMTRARTVMAKTIMPKGTNAGPEDFFGLSISGNGRSYELFGDSYVDVMKNVARNAFGLIGSIPKDHIVFIVLPELIKEKLMNDMQLQWFGSEGYPLSVPESRRTSVKGTSSWWLDGAFYNGYIFDLTSAITFPTHANTNEIVLCFGSLRGLSLPDKENLRAPDDYHYLVGSCTVSPLTEQNA